jgi:hypothetical protein
MTALTFQVVYNSLGSLAKRATSAEVVSYFQHLHALWLHTPHGTRKICKTRHHGVVCREHDVYPPWSLGDARSAWLLPLPHCATHVSDRSCR